jgi:hypothetical protein
MMSDIQRAAKFARIRIAAECIEETVEKISAKLDTRTGVDRLADEVVKLATLVRELATLAES